MTSPSRIDSTTPAAPSRVRPIAAPATTGVPGPQASPPPSLDALMTSPSPTCVAWNLPPKLEDSGPELRRHVALFLRDDSTLQRLERQYAQGHIDDATYMALRKDCVERCAFMARNEFEAAAAAREGVSQTYFAVRNCNMLLTFAAKEMGDYPGKALEDLRWDVFDRFQKSAAADPEIQKLNKARDDRRKQLPAGVNPDDDMAFGALSAKIRVRENTLRQGVQDAYVQELDQHLEIDAPTRKAMKEFVKASQPGTISTGVWSSLSATVIRAATHRPGELDASHAAVAVAPGLYYESLINPPPEVSGVKATSALEYFASFHGSVRTQPVPDLTPDQVQRLYDFAITKQGTPFNRLGLALGIKGISNDPKDDSAYYCAEFVARALTQAGVSIQSREANTPFDDPAKADPSNATIRIARALPYTVVRILAPSLAKRLNPVGLTLDDAVGNPRMSPQKLINATFNGKPLPVTFDRTVGRDRRD